MSWWRQLTRGLRVLTNRDAVDRDLADEVQHFEDEAAAAHVARGLDPEAARRAARLDAGNAAAVRDEVRAFQWETLVDAIAADVRYAARRLRSTPGFTAVAVVTLALGIGASTAIFSAVHPILFEPLPYPDAGQLAMISYAGADGARVSQTFGTYRELADRSRAFDALAVARPWQPTITGSDTPERLEGQRVSASYFRVLGVTPALGHEFNPSDDRLNGPNAVILGHGLWRRRFGADGSIVGRSITLNDRTYTVVGVMPGAFHNALAPDAEIWALLQYDATLPAQGREWGHHLQMIGRVKAGLAFDVAARELDTIARQPVPEHPRQPGSTMNRGLLPGRLKTEVTRAVAPALLAVLGAVLMVLAIACVNVTNLLLARADERRGEVAMRAALGATRSRIVRQLLMESLLLAFAGGAVGLVVAVFGTRALVAVSPVELTRLAAIRVDGAVYLFGLVLMTVVGLVVGLVPAWQAARGGLQAGLQLGGRRASTRRHVTSRVLVVAEIALALVLLVGAGLLWRSLERLFAVSPGIDPSQVLTMQVQVSSPRRYADSAAIHRFYAEALAAVRDVPGVADAAFTSQLPLSGDFEVFGIRFEPGDVDRPEGSDAFRYAVTPGYFRTLGIPLRRGRLLDERDMSAASPRAVLINESLANRAFGGADPIGRRLRFGGPADRPWDVIVGVVGDVKQATLAMGQSDAVYVASAQWLWADNPRSLVVRAHGDAASLAAAVRSAVWSVDKDQPIVRVATLDALLSATAAERRYALTLFNAFAAAALLLGAIGIYGVLAGSVSERTREFGVRVALGASTGQIVGMVMRQGLILTTIGIAVGVAGAAVSSRVLMTLLFSISPLDPATYAGVVAILIAVAATACWLPAWRAARIDPAMTLKAE